jgi:hypothetical protein
MGILGFDGLAGLQPCDEGADGAALGSLADSIQRPVHPAILPMGWVLAMSREAVEPNVQH